MSGSRVLQAGGSVVVASERAHRKPLFPAPALRSSPLSHMQRQTSGSRRRAALAGPACAVARPASERPMSGGQPGREADMAAGAAELRASHPFNWRQQWYPLAPSSYLDRSSPAAFTVLGRNLVVWYHRASRSWRAFDDACPHRLAPLSEGRIDPGTGNLQCSYHGWQFGGDGACTSIPQAGSSWQQFVACESCRSRVPSYPVQEQQGLLWVWMDATPDSVPASRQRPVAVPSELRTAPGSSATQATSGMLLGDWYMRELPVSFDYLLENLLDPAHVHFAHHGLIGDRSRAGNIELEQQGPLTAQGGFKLHMQQQQRQAWQSARQERGAFDDLPGLEGLGSSGARQWQGRSVRQQHPAFEQHGAFDGLLGLSSEGTRQRDGMFTLPGLEGLGGSASAAAGMPSVTHFLPPSLAWLEMPSGIGASHFSLVFYAVPVRPGVSRIFAGYSTDAIPPPLQAALRSAALEPLLHAFQFLGDLASHEVIDGDLIHINRQEQLARSGRSSWRQAYYMPTTSDKGVVLLRRWLEDKAGGGPDYGPAAGQAPSAAPKPLSRREILDRYEQHTRHCPSCRQAVGNVRLARQLLQAAAASGSAAAMLAAVQALLLPLPLAPPPLGPSRTSLPMLFGTAALLAGVLERMLGQLEDRFLFVDYVHAAK